MKSRISFFASAALALLCTATPTMAEPTEIEVRVLARGAKFLGGYQFPVRVTLTDADTGEVLARGLTAGTTGDTNRILSKGRDSDGRLSTPDSAVFRTTLNLDRARRLTLSATGPLSQPQATATATSTQWILPGHSLVAQDGWLLELPGLIVDVAAPMAYQSTKAGSRVPLRVGVTMLCGCRLTENGPWRTGDMDVSAHVSVNGSVPKRMKLTYDGNTDTFGADIPTEQPGLYEVEIRAWAAATSNAGVAHVAFFSR